MLWMMTVFFVPWSFKKEVKLSTCCEESLCLGSNANEGMRIGFVWSMHRSRFLQLEAISD